MHGLQTCLNFSPSLELVCHCTYSGNFWSLCLSVWHRGTPFTALLFCWGLKRESNSWLHLSEFGHQILLLAVWGQGAACLQEIVTWVRLGVRVEILRVQTPRPTQAGFNDSRFFYFLCQAMHGTPLVIFFCLRWGTPLPHPWWCGSLVGLAVLRSWPFSQKMDHATWIYTDSVTR